MTKENENIEKNNNLNRNTITIGEKNAEAYLFRIQEACLFTYLGSLYADYIVHMCKVTIHHPTRDFNKQLSISKTMIMSSQLLFRPGRVSITPCHTANQNVNCA